jgi:hypothetical protein
MRSTGTTGGRCNAQRSSWVKCQASEKSVPYLGVGNEWRVRQQVAETGGASAQRPSGSARLHVTTRTEASTRRSPEV